MLSTDTLTYICRAAVLLFLLPVHEYSHARVALALGDETAENEGRITLNPFRHLDPIGSGLLFFAGVGWAKPVPVDAQNFKNPKYGMALTALAGPVANIVMALILVVLAQIAAGVASLGIAEGDTLFYLVLLLEITAQISVNLAVFNLIPIPPLDGSRLVAAVLPDRLMYAYYSRMQAVSMVFLALMLFTDLLSNVIFFFSDNIMSALVWATSFIPMLF